MLTIIIFTALVAMLWRANLQHGEAPASPTTVYVAGRRVQVNLASLRAGREEQN